MVEHTRQSWTDPNPSAWQKLDQQAAGSETGGLSTRDDVLPLGVVRGRAGHWT
ncbi:hypothetical protein [Actinocrispum sp. NPDC049592]|uniref:hypothetical protein n=1 Tax=Actinocrispum sp. NPDC049592 TaxID=3154835 RepID=UPI00343E9DAB